MIITTRVLLIALFLLTTQACSADNNNSKTPEAPSSSSSETDLKPGENLADKLSKIEVQNLNQQSLNLKNILSKYQSNKVIILVKPGCVFCESFLATAYSNNIKSKAHIYIFLDKKHASFEEFKKKAELNKKIKAEWFYDFDDKLSSDLGMSSFPRFLVLDKNHKVLANQIGLVMPQDRSKLAQLEFPVILQKLSHDTVEWLKSF
jgi:glutaredoxin